jgi:YVTN family beta-propeller protein
LLCFPGTLTATKSSAKIARTPCRSCDIAFGSRISKDGTRIYVSNEDIKTATVINIASGKVEHLIPVGGEPEGVGVTPDGKQFACKEDLTISSVLAQAP